MNPKKKSIKPIIILLLLIPILLLLVFFSIMMIGIRSSRDSVASLVDSKETEQWIEDSVSASEAESVTYKESVSGSTTYTASGSASSSTSTEVTTPDGGDYMFADSSTRLLTESDLAGLSSEQLRIARNEIYARHGRKFNDTGLQAYFDSKSWYNGTIEADAFSESILNDTEKANAEFIKSHE